MTLVWHLLSLVALTVVSRVVPRLLRPDAMSADAYYHLLAAQRIRENGFRLPERLRGLFFPGPYDYPPLFHVLLAMVPARMIARAERVVSVVIDALYVALCYAFVRYALVVGYEVDASVAARRALLLASLLALSPALLYVGRGPRTYNANPRILAELLFGGVMAATFVWAMDGGVLALLAAGVLAGVLLLSSKFGAQVVVAFLPLLALATRRADLLVVPASGLLAAVLVSRGHYLRVLRGHVGHLTLFGRLGNERGSPRADRSEWREFGRLLGSLATPSAWYRLLCVNSIGSFLVRNPQLVLVALVAPAIAASTATSLLLAWIAVSLVVFLAISLRPLLFLGEAERYVAYSVPAQLAVLGAGWEAVPSWAWWLLLAYSVVVSAGYQAIFVRLARRDPASLAQRREVVAFLRAQPQCRRILPVGEAPHSLAYLSGQEVFYPCGNFQIWETTLSEYRRIYDEFARPRVDTLAETSARYGIDTILVNKRQDSSIAAALQHHPVLFENAAYVVFDFSRVRDGRVLARALSEA
jgi:hypothetical protein